MIQIVTYMYAASLCSSEKSTANTSIIPPPSQYIHTHTTRLRQVSPKSPKNQAETACIQEE